jgi:hypothetical protein
MVKGPGLVTKPHCNLLAICATSQCSLASSGPFGPETVASEEHTYPLAGMAPSPRGSQAGIDQGPAKVREHWGAKQPSSMKSALESDDSKLFLS